MPEEETMKSRFLSNCEDECPKSASARALVERFYYQGWNKRDMNTLRVCLSPDVKFRGGLGMTRRNKGVDNYVEHCKAVQATIERYSIGIEDLVVSQNGSKVAVRCVSRGLHRGTFFGVKGDGCEVSWANAAFLTIGDGKIVDIWVLGDTDSLKHQVGAVNCDETS